MAGRDFGNRQLGDPTFALTPAHNRAHPISEAYRRRPERLTRSRLSRRYISTLNARSITSSCEKFSSSDVYAFLIKSTFVSVAMLAATEPDVIAHRPRTGHR